MPTKTDIRTAAQSQIVTGAAFGARVFIGKKDALSEDQLPAAVVQIVSEEIELISHTPRRFVRRLELMIEGYDKATASLETEERLDILADAIEAAILTDKTLGGIVKDCRPVNIEYENPDAGSQVFGTIKMTYSVEYETQES